MGVDSLTREMAVVLRQYHVHPNRIRRSERGVLVTVNQEVGWLQPWSRRIDAQRYVRVYRLLAGQDSTIVLPLIQTKKRQDAVFTSRRAYTFSRWPEHAEQLGLPRSEEEFGRWGEGLGQVHRLLARAGEAGRFNGAPSDRSADTFPFAGWLETMRQRRQKILDVRQQWLATDHLPAEEQLFLRNIPPMMERLESAIGLLNDLQRRAVPPFGGWTLGDLKDSFLSLPSGRLKVAPWKRWLPGHGLSDLGRLLLLASEMPDPIRAAKAAVDGFEREWPLTAEAFQALLAYMLFPHALWSLVHQALAAPKRPSARLDGPTSTYPQLPVDLQQLRDIYRQEQHRRVLLTWLNQQFSQRRAPGAVVRRLTES